MQHIAADRLEDNGNLYFALWAGSYEVKLNREEAYRNLVVAQFFLLANLSTLISEHVEQFTIESFIRHYS